MYNMDNHRNATRLMVNVVVVGPPRSGKTQLVHAICGVKTDYALRPTTCVGHMSCTLCKVPLVLWDTPGCCGSKVPDLAQGVVSDCDVAIVCYDGRRCWSPTALVEVIGRHRCFIYLTHPGAFNASLARETFDLYSSFISLVPVHAHKDVMICDILRTTTAPHQRALEDEMPLVDSV